MQLAALACLISLAHGARHHPSLSTRAAHRGLSGAARESWLRARLAAGELGAHPREYVGDFARDKVYWWRYNHSDCAYHDIDGHHHPFESVDELKAICLNTTGCHGFNTNGVLKDMDCEGTNITAEIACDLYVAEDRPQPNEANFPPVWPLPKNWTAGNTTASMGPTGFKATGAACSDLDNAFTRYQAQTFPRRLSARAAQMFRGAAPIEVKVASCDEPLQLGVDESYTLSVGTDGAVKIEAATQYGAFHGMETLSQLVRFDFDQKAYFVDNAPWVIEDAPRFAHREVLLDSARHFEPVETLKNMIQSLTYAKINTVHWHIVDQQSFPFDSVSYPLLASKGAWSPQERFTPEDVADVVEFARARGVRVMVEVDTPGHAASWCNGYPEVCPDPKCPEPLNVASNKTFDLIQGLFNDMTGGKRGKGLFFDNVMHLGGDEVNTKCWTNTPSVAQWLADRNMTGDDGYAYFVQRVQGIAHDQGRDVAGWEEIWKHFGTKLDKSTIIHQWLPGSTAAPNVTANGYRLLWSTDGVWYLDGLKTSWQTMYGQEPCKGIDDATCAKYVLGGGGEQWGETVDTSDIFSTVWPRLGAIAERLWSPRDKASDLDLAAPRFAAFRCMMNRRGVPAAPVNNKEARQSPPGPGSCYTQ